MTPGHPIDFDSFYPTENMCLALYLATCLADEPSLDLYSVWSGDEGVAPEHTRTLRLVELLEHDFAILERQLASVTV